MGKIEQGIQEAIKSKEKITYSLQVKNHLNKLDETKNMGKIEIEIHYQTYEKLKSTIRDQFPGVL